MILGGIIGLEREISGKPAGLRTNILICLGSALLMDLSVQIGMLGALASEGRIGDPGRMAAQVISGIGFLGAGTIMQARGAVIGLTTAATIWVVAAIGLTVGAGLYIEASGAALLVAAVLVGLGRVERRLLSVRRTLRGTVRVVRDASWENIEAVINSLGLHVRSKQVYEHPGDRAFELQVVGPSRQFDVLIAELARRNDVISVQLD
ncbi:MAG: MgtC/SapB family protein [Gemmatimonadaceae bacterium]